MSPLPHFVTYHDQNDYANLLPPDVSYIKGFNVYNLAFLLTTGATDRVAAWASLSPAEREVVKSKYNSAGIKFFVSVFGFSDKPTTKDPIEVANNVAQWTKEYHVDGVDVNYEDEDAFRKGDGSAEKWIIAFTKHLRFLLPPGHLITHAPIARWFRPNYWGGGGYLKIHSEVGNLIDWYNVQYGHLYATPETILKKSGTDWPETAVFQIHSNGVTLSKILIGKTALPQDTPASVLALVLEQGKNDGWHGGVAAWQYPNTDTKWIREVRSKSWPV